MANFPHESRTSSDALVFFGATGDLAHKKIFPALQAMRGHLNVPVIGVAKAGWSLNQLRVRDGTAWRRTAAVSTALPSTSSLRCFAMSTATTEIWRPSRSSASELGGYAP